VTSGTSDVERRCRVLRDAGYDGPIDGDGYPILSNPPPTDEWQGDVAATAEAFRYELCSDCGRDLEDHTISPGPPFGQVTVRCRL
jgi:hypothetical protein